MTVPRYGMSQGAGLFSFVLRLTRGSICYMKQLSAPQRSIAQRATEAVKAALLAAPGETATAYRAVADLLVDLRQTIITPSGLPDWSGRSAEYRAAVQGIYADASVPQSVRGNLQAAIRWHVSQAVRERVPADELKDTGLMEQSTRDRSRDRSEERAALLRAVQHGEPVRGLDPVASATAVAALLAGVDARKVRKLSVRRGAVLAERLAEISGAVEKLQRVTE